MIKRFIILLGVIAIQSALAVTLQLSTGKNDGEEYGILTLSHQQAFQCSAINDKRIECIFPHIPQSPKNFSNRFGSWIMSGNKAIFQSHQNVRLFANPDFPYTFQEQKKNVKNSIKWQIVIFGYRTPFITPDVSTKGLNFPITLNLAAYPMVGSLDAGGMPVKEISGQSEINAYLEATRQFDKKNYDKVISIADRALNRSPHSLFRAELSYLKLKSLSKTQEGAEGLRRVLTLATEWVKEYSSDSHLPEVLLLLADANSRVGSRKDAAYYYEQIIDEYDKTPVGYEAMLHYADYLYGVGYQKRGLELYNKVLYETKDIRQAAQASFKLGMKLLDTKAYNQAIPYFRKIYDADKALYTDEPLKALPILDGFIVLKDYKYALPLSKDLLEVLDKKSKEFEELLFKRAELLHYSGDLRGAKEAYGQYIKMIPDGKYIKEAKLRKDKLLFDTEESNDINQRMALYDKVLQEYPLTTEMGQTAFYRKMKIKFTAGAYQEILENKSSLLKLSKNIAPDKDFMISQSANKLAYQALKDNRCNDAFSLANQYNIGFGKEWDEQKFRCYYSLSKFKEAQTIAHTKVKEVELSQKLLWLYRDYKTLLQLNNKTDALFAGLDLYKLIDLTKTRDKDYDNLLYELFQLAKEQNKITTMLDISILIEKRYPNANQNISIYSALVYAGIRQKDTLMMLSNAKKIIDWQRKFKSYPESPRIDFIYLEGMQKKGDTKEVLTVAENLLKLSQLKPQERSRALYMSASSSITLGNATLAKQRLNECVALGKQGGNWSLLCRDTLDVMK